MDMDHIGVIGYGHMGSMLVSGFLSSGALDIGEVVVTSRSRESRDACAAAWPGIDIAVTNRELARRCRTIIIAVRPQETKDVLREIVPVMEGDEYIVSLAAGISLAELEGLFSGSVTRAVPTITSTLGRGTTLICHGRQVDVQGASRVEGLFSSIGNVMLVEEEELPAATILSSCGPGLLAAIIEELAGAAIRAGGLTPERALLLAIEAAGATAAYLRETGEAPGDLVGRVATAGGVTEAGVKELRERLPEVFDEAVTAMLARYGAVGK